MKAMEDTAFILIVEGEKGGSDALCEGLQRAGHACHVVSTGKEAVESIKQRSPDVVITDYRLGGDLNGMDVLRRTKEISPDTEVILITAHGSEQLARDALSRDGEYCAYDYVVKPLDLDVMCEKVKRASCQALDSRRNRVMREQLDRAFRFEGIIGSCEAMSRIVKRVRRVANTKITVLIIGESGTGKELIAQALHTNSQRSSKPYRAINCAGLNENLLESQLFGHLKGAFTGAITDRKGLFEAADGGTLFLDEVGDMPLPMQAKLLRTLDSGEVLPVGATDIHHVDVRVVAATHQNLSDLVSERKFREDLFYRLNQVILRLPPLRERREDIPLLVNHFLGEANLAYGKKVKGFSGEVMRKLTNYSWRGNVRELKSLIESVVALTDNDQIEMDDLPEPYSGSTDIVPSGAGALAGLSMADVEKLHILSTLKLTGGNREKAAKLLKIGARTLYRKLKDYEIT